MTTTIGLGNSPSAGSTFFSDLLDSTIYTAVGPELNLFSLEYLYEFNTFKNKLKENSRFFSVYLRRNGIVYNDICAYGLDENKFANLVNSSKNIEEFLNKFALHFLSLRGKNTQGVVYEKSPQNIHCIKQYLENTNNYFVHIVRNPINVYKSLLKRGFLDKIALITWLLDEAKIYDYLDHERVVVVNYEDLVKDPYKMTKEVIKKTSGIDVSEEEIQKSYENNEYRKYHTPKLDSWTNKSFGIVGKEKKKSFSEDELKSLASLQNLKVSKKYAEYFDMADVSFLELIKKLGYEDSYFETIQNINTDFSFSKDEKYKLFRKYTGDLKYRDAKLFDLSIYLNPVENI